MIERRESCGSNSAVRFIRSGILALVLAACSVGCGSGEYLSRSNKPDAAVKVKPDSGLEKFLRCVRKAVKRSALKSDEIKKEGGWDFKECYR